MRLKWRVEIQQVGRCAIHLGHLTRETHKYGVENRVISFLELQRTTNNFCGSYEVKTRVVKTGQTVDCSFET